jgi:hypothetical protein
MVSAEIDEFRNGVGKNPEVQQALAELERNMARI